MSPMPSSRRSATACVLALLLVLGACSSGGPSAPVGDAVDSPGSSDAAQPGDLIVQVASYDLAVGPPARIIVGIQSGDQRLLVYGTVTLRFSYLGTKEGPVEAPPQGPPVPAGYLPIPGTPDPPDGVSAPQLVSGAQARGVYGATAAFDRAGFWEAEVTANVGGAEQVATGAFTVLERHTVPAPGDPAPGRTTTPWTRRPTSPGRPSTPGPAATGRSPSPTPSSTPPPSPPPSRPSGRSW